MYLNPSSPVSLSFPASTIPSADSTASSSNNTSHTDDSLLQLQQQLISDNINNQNILNKNVDLVATSVQTSALIDDSSISGKTLMSMDAMALMLTDVAKELSLKEGHVHRGITCNMCHKSPIKGVRYKCANCVDFDICETCEYQDASRFHPKTHVFLKIRIPIPPLCNPRSALLNVFYAGGDPSVDFSHCTTWTIIKPLIDQTHFNVHEIHALYDQFQTLARKHATWTKPGIDKPTFMQCLGPISTQENLISDRLFLFFDQNSDGIIEFQEFVRGLSILSRGTIDEKIRHAFNGYDLDNDDKISRVELLQMYKAYFGVSMELVRDVVRSFEEDVVETFNEQDEKPVSSMFTAPIPPSSAINTSKSTGAIVNGNYSGLMETLSQDAIEEMVDKTFKAFNKTGHSTTSTTATATCTDNNSISFEEFAKYAKADTSLIAWFESLGTIF